MSKKAITVGILIGIAISVAIAAAMGSVGGSVGRYQMAMRGDATAIVVVLDTQTGTVNHVNFVHDPATGQAKPNEVRQFQAELAQ